MNLTVDNVNEALRCDPVKNKALHVVRSTWRLRPVCESRSSGEWASWWMSEANSPQGLGTSFHWVLHTCAGKCLVGLDPEARLVNLSLTETWVSCWDRGVVSKRVLRLMSSIMVFFVNGTSSRCQTTEERNKDFLTRKSWLWGPSGLTAPRQSNPQVYLDSTDVLVHRCYWIHDIETIHSPTNACEAEVLIYVSISHNMGFCFRDRGVYQ